MLTSKQSKTQANYLGNNVHNNLKNYYKQRYSVEQKIDCFDDLPAHSEVAAADVSAWIGSAS